MINMSRDDFKNFLLEDERNVIESIDNPINGSENTNNKKSPWMCGIILILIAFAIIIPAIYFTDVYHKKKLNEYLNDHIVIEGDMNIFPDQCKNFSVILKKSIYYFNCKYNECKEDRSIINGFICNPSIYFNVGLWYYVDEQIYLAFDFYLPNGRFSIPVIYNRNDPRKNSVYMSRIYDMQPFFVIMLSAFVFIEYLLLTVVSICCVIHIILGIKIYKLNRYCVCERCADNQNRSIIIN